MRAVRCRGLEGALRFGTLRRSTLNGRLLDRRRLLHGQRLHHRTFTLRLNPFATLEFRWPTIIALPIASLPIASLGRRAGDQRVVGATVIALRLIKPAALLIIIVVDIRVLLHALGLLSRLRDRVDDAEIMLRMLKVSLRHDPVAGTGGVASKLQISLEKLLRGAAYAQIRPVAVEHMVSVERDLTIMVTDRAAPAAAAGTMIAAPHAFHVHQSVAALS